VRLKTVITSALRSPWWCRLVGRSGLDLGIRSAFSNGSGPRPYTRTACDWTTLLLRSEVLASGFWTQRSPAYWNAIVLRSAYD
jgi:hypothetical protein